MNNGGMLTFSGQMVSPVEGVPTLEDIGLALSRIPRFGGHARTEWTVLNHTIVCARLCEHYFPDDALIRLAVMLHDAHEALTGDVPSPMKKATDVDVLQGSLDHRIYDAYFPGGYRGFWYGELLRERVHYIDGRALCAEAVVVGPPAVTMQNVAELFGAVPLAREVGIVAVEAQLTARYGQADNWLELEALALKNKLPLD